MPEGLAEGEVFSEAQGVGQGWQAWGCAAVQYTSCCWARDPWCAQEPQDLECPDLQSRPGFGETLSGTRRAIA